MWLALFGSVAWGDADADSDVDLMAEFDNHRVSTILTRVHLENRIGDLLGMKVDLAHAAAMRPGIGERATR